MEQVRVFLLIDSNSIARGSPIREIQEVRRQMKDGSSFSEAFDSVASGRAWGGYNEWDAGPGAL